MSDRDDAVREIWSSMRDFVLDNQHRKRVAEATGVSFARSRTLRRLIAGPLTMSELAAKLSIEPPNASTLVNDLEAQGLAERVPHPTDRRARLVELTPKGRAVAEQAKAILDHPPSGFDDLSDAELTALRDLLRRAAGGNAD